MIHLLLRSLVVVAYLGASQHPNPRRENMATVSPNVLAIFCMPMIPSLSFFLSFFLLFFFWNLPCEFINTVVLGGNIVENDHQVDHGFMRCYLYCFHVCGTSSSGEFVVLSQMSMEPIQRHTFDISACSWLSSKKKRTPSSIYAGCFTLLLL